MEDQEDVIPALRKEQCGYCNEMRYPYEFGEYQKSLKRKKCKSCVCQESRMKRLKREGKSTGYSWKTVQQKNLKKMNDRIKK